MIKSLNTRGSKTHRLGPVNFTSDCDEEELDALGGDGEGDEPKPESEASHGPAHVAADAPFVAVETRILPSPKLDRPERRQR